DERLNRQGPDFGVDPAITENNVGSAADLLGGILSAPVRKGSGKRYEQIAIESVDSRPEDTDQVGRLALRLLLSGLPAAKVGALDELGRPELSMKEGANQLGVQIQILAAINHIAEESSLAFGILDGCSGGPLPACHVVH